MILDGKKLKEKIIIQLNEEVNKLNVKPNLCVIQIGNDEASNIYIKQKEKMCNNIGYGFIHQKFNSDVSEDEILNTIDNLNKDEKTSAILVQMPIPSSLNSTKIQNMIEPLKDVDGLSNVNIANLITKKDGLFPCTASGIVNLLDEYNIEIEGKDILIIGRSMLVGTPLFYMLENKNATVTLAHSKTKNLKEKTLKADIIVCAVGQKNLITKDMIKKDAIIIDVGINRDTNNKICGDTDFESLKDIASYITPTPGGVGPMTIASLAKNILKAYKMQKDID